MNFHLLTLFPDIIKGYADSSIAAKAAESGVISFDIVNIRDYARDKHKNCDDYPFGGGAGMVMKPEPLAGALDAVKAEHARVIYPTPAGRLLTQQYAEELSLEMDIVFICGRYEGIDQRIIDIYVDDEISIGDYVISSGEIAALVIVDAVYRLVEGVINAESLAEESFTPGLLEYPQYTRPRDFKGLEVPEVLLSGHHERIREWRLKKSVEKTMQNRPELLRTRQVSEEVLDIMNNLPHGGIENGSYKGN